jgi:hypothetical protein
VIGAKNQRNFNEARVAGSQFPGSGLVALFPHRFDPNRHFVAFIRAADVDQEVAVARRAIVLGYAKIPGPPPVCTQTTGC